VSDDRSATGRVGIDVGIIVDALRNQKTLTTIHTFNIAAHCSTPNRRRSGYQDDSFSHSLHAERLLGRLMFMSAFEK
jgi:hypothetical protein